MTEITWSSSLAIAGTVDVLVAGGGMAGVGAAVAAARHGARTLLVERLEILGGLGTSGAVGNFCFGNDTLPAGQGAVFTDIWQRLAAYGAIGSIHGWSTRHAPPLYYNHPFDHQVCALVLQELAEEAGVTLLFATDVVGATVDNGCVSAVIVHNRSLLQAVGVRQCIDASGDGILARHAGATALPPDPEHPGSIPPSHMMLMQRSETPRAQVVRRPAEGPPPKFSVWPEPERIALKMWWRDGDFDTATGHGYSEAGRAFRRRIPEFARAFQADHPDYVYAGAAPMLGLRDGVRVEGDYVLTADDLRAGRQFPDTVAHGCFPLDSAAIEKEIMPPYGIPYRSLLVKGLANVLVAGRCFSATRVALSSARIMPTACLMGQAAGHAAALACAADAPLRTVTASEIRRALLDSGDAVLRERLKGDT